MFGQSFVFGSIAGGGADSEVDFLMIAGGGANGNYRSGIGGGGGAGGYRTSYGTTSGGGAAAESKLLFESGTTYTITVGAGGVAAGGQGPGGTSSIVGGSINESCVGGGSFFINYFWVTSPQTGGSGAGGGYDGANSSRTGGGGTTNQGFASRNVATGNYNGTAYYWVPGGGGAGALPPTTYPGQGGYTSGYAGAGLKNTIVSSSNATTAGVGQLKGTDTWYASGGMGLGVQQSSRSTYLSSGSTDVNAYNYAGSPGGGGLDFSNGLPNTGGGAGSSSYLAFGSIKLGGSGVVVLRMPTANYSGTTTGSPDVFTEGSDTVIVFSGSGSYKH